MILGYLQAQRVAVSPGGGLVINSWLQVRSERLNDDAPYLLPELALVEGLQMKGNAVSRASNLRRAPLQ